jgi:hypothetical protein
MLWTLAFTIRKNILCTPKLSKSSFPLKISQTWLLSAMGAIFLREAMGEGQLWGWNSGALYK